jgi:hypothetical protein
MSGESSMNIYMSGESSFLVSPLGIYMSGESCTKIVLEYYDVRIYVQSLHFGESSVGIYMSVESSTETLRINIYIYVCPVTSFW